MKASLVIWLFLGRIKNDFSLIICPIASVVFEIWFPRRYDSEKELMGMIQFLYWYFKLLGAIMEDEVDHNRHQDNYPHWVAHLTPSEAPTECGSEKDAESNAGSDDMDWEYLEKPEVLTCT
jgi:hypothetical protein